MELKEIDYLIDLLLKARNEIVDKQETTDDAWMDKAAKEYENYRC